MSSTTRTPHNSDTPQTTVFTIPLTPIQESDRSSSTFDHSQSILTSKTFGGILGFMRYAYFGVVGTITNNTGMLLVAGAEAFFSFMAVSVKVLNGLEEPVPTSEVILVRMIITWICCQAYMSITKIPDPILGPKGVRLLLALRGLGAFFGLFGLYFSLQYLSLSDATVLTFLAPMCTAVTGALILKEGFSYKQAIAGFCSLLGVILIARPDFLFRDAEKAPDINDEATPAQRLAAVGVSLLGVCGATVDYTTIRAIGTRAHTLHNLVAFSTLCVIVTSTWLMASRTPLVIPTRPDWILMLFMIGIFGFIAQCLMTSGLQRETASRATMAMYVQIIFATALDRIIFHTVPPLLSVIGILIIVTSAIYVAVIKLNMDTETPVGKVFSDLSDISLEEGLLANQEDDDAEDTFDSSKDAIATDVEAILIDKSYLHRVQNPDESSR